MRVGKRVSTPSMFSQVLRDYWVTAIGQYASAAARAARGFILAAILSPTNLGAVAIMNLVIGFAQYSDLGMSYAVQREVALREGRAEGGVRRWTWYALLANLLGGSVVLAGCVFWAIAPGAAQDASVRTAVIAAGSSALFLGLGTAVYLSLQARRQFGRAARVLLTLSIANLVFSVVGASAMGVRGVLIGQVSATVLALGVAAMQGAIEGRPAVHRSEYGTLARIGFPLAAMAFMGFALENVDQVIILGLLDRERLGVYSIVLAAGSALSLLPLSLSNVIGPRLMQAYGRDSRVESIARYTWKPVRVLGTFLPVAILAVWVVAPVLILWLLPAYGGAVAPLRLYLVGQFFLGMNLGVSSTLIALGKHHYNVMLMLVCVGLNIAIDAVLVGVLRLGLEGVAIGSFCAYAAYWFLHTWRVRRQFASSAVQVLAGNVVSGVPGIVLALYAAWVWSTGRLGSIDLARDGSALGFSVLFGIAWWAYGRGHGWPRGTYE
jgi:O-antigen/teichoic acid export membrane protein